MNRMQRHAKVTGAGSIELDDLSRFEGDGGTGNEANVNHVMKQNLETTKHDCGDLPGGGTETAQRVGKPGAFEEAGVSKQFRRLKWNEVVRRGDFVADEHQGFEPWEGPGGFQADSFLKPIYRRAESRSTSTQKLK